MDKVLIAYCVTQSLHRVIDASRTCRKLFASYGKGVFSECLVSDAPNFHYPASQITDPAIGDRETHNLARMRNHAFNYARQTDADWLVTLDADSIFLGVSKFPSTGYGKLDVFFQGEEESVGLLPLSDKSRWSKASWWIFSREIFSNPKLRHDENYLGQHGADWDFMENVLKPAGVVESETDAAAIHLWHPSRENKEQHAANMLRYEEKRKARGV